MEQTALPAPPVPEHGVGANECLPGESDYDVHTVQRGLAGEQVGNRSLTFLGVFWEGGLDPTTYSPRS